MFRKQALNIPPAKGAFLSADRASELLFRAAQMPVGFEFVAVDKPADGTLFVFLPSPALPEDGYGYQDDEIYSTQTTAQGLVLDIYTRSMGFAPTDSFVTIRRKRYRVQGQELMLMHYIASDSRTPIQPHLVKQKPRASKPLLQDKNKKVVSVAEQAIGDELDFKTMNHLKRYRRNHELIEAIFTPKNTGIYELI